MVLKATRIRRLYCSCCGAHTIGRQWHNRDTGYGLCETCAEKIASKETPEEMRSCYGEKGRHYAIENAEEQLRLETLKLEDQAPAMRNALIHLLNSAERGTHLLEDLTYREQVRDILIMAGAEA